MISVNALIITTQDDLFAGIGSGDIRIETVVNKLRDVFNKPEDSTIPDIKAGKGESTSNGIVIEGVDGVLIRLASCCRPLPGDPIVGYITRGRGISVHRKDCPNAIRYQETEPDRLMEVKWGNNTTGQYNVEMEAVAIDRDRLLIDIMAIMAETKTAVNGVRVTVDKRTKTSTIMLKVEVKSLDQLDYLMQRVRRVKDVLECSPCSYS